MDMVCEKEPGCTIDFENDGLTLEVNGDYISAKEQPLAATMELQLHMHWQS